MQIKTILVLDGITGQTKQRVRTLHVLDYEVETISDTAINYAPGIDL